LLGYRKLNGDERDKEKERESHMREGKGKGMNIQNAPYTRRKKSLEAFWILCCL